jgi:hypothetical protein
MKLCGWTTERAFRCLSKKRLGDLRIVTNLRSSCSGSSVGITASGFSAMRVTCVSGRFHCCRCEVLNRCEWSWLRERDLTPCCLVEVFQLFGRIHCFHRTAEMERDHVSPKRQKFCTVLQGVIRDDSLFVVWGRGCGLDWGGSGWGQVAVGRDNGVNCRAWMSGIFERLLANGTAWIGCTFRIGPLKHNVIMCVAWYIMKTPWLTHLVYLCSSNASQSSLLLLPSSVDWSDCVKETQCVTWIDILALVYLRYCSSYLLQLKRPSLPLVKPAHVLQFTSFVSPCLKAWSLVCLDCFRLLPIGRSIVNCRKQRRTGEHTAAKCRTDLHSNRVQVWHIALCTWVDFLIFQNNIVPSKRRELVTQPPTASYQSNESPETTHCRGNVKCLKFEVHSYSCIWARISLVVSTTVRRPKVWGFLFLPYSHICVQGIQTEGKCFTCL